MAMDVIESKRFGESGKAPLELAAANFALGLLGMSRLLRGLGLSPEVQDTVSVEGGELSASAGGVGLAHVRNVVALIPGTASTGRVFLVAHYDSAQVAPGGNDDAAGTATLLETARALTSGARPRNDVVLVLTDAEEACLCGAKAFVDQHPEFEVPVERLATWLARGGTDDSDD